MLPLPNCPFEIYVQTPCRETIASWLSGQPNAQSIQDIADHFNQPIADTIKEILEYKPDLTFGGFGFIFHDISLEDIIVNEDGNMDIKTYIKPDTLVCILDKQIGKLDNGFA